MRILIVSNTDFSVINFRKELINCLVKEGHEVVIVTELSSYLSDLQKLGVSVVNINYPKRQTNFLGLLNLVYQNQNNQ